MAVKKRIEIEVSLTDVQKAYNTFDKLKKRFLDIEAEKKKALSLKEFYAGLHGDLIPKIYQSTNAFANKKVAFRNPQNILNTRLSGGFDQFDQHAVRYRKEEAAKAAEELRKNDETQQDSKVRNLWNNEKRVRQVREQSYKQGLELKKKNEKAAVEAAKKAQKEIDAIQDTQVRQLWNNESRTRQVRKESYKQANDLAKKLAKQRIKDEDERVKELNARYKRVTKGWEKDYADGEKERKRNIAKAKEARREIDSEVHSYFQTAFSFHILQMYALPLIYYLRQISTQIISVFADFDKKFNDYVVKSEEFGENLSRKDFFNVAAGQTFGLVNATMAAERFAASGVDVAKNQEALIATMQVATIANMEYNDAANGVIKTMQAMHLNIRDITQITDALINSANASTAELSDLVKWFEYSASGAYQMGLNVKQLSAYLGILASTGMPNTGAAARQLFAQLNKENIQQKFKERFAFITDEDFRHIDTLIGKLRDYVQSSEDQSAASSEIVRILEGRVNAQQALNNLLVAEPGLWNQVTNAVAKTGTTQKLYEKSTKNAADEIARIKANFEVLAAQVGTFIAPILYVIEKVTTVIAKVVTQMPDLFKPLVGSAIAATAAVGTTIFVMLGAAGALMVMQGATEMLRNKKVKFIATIGELKIALMDLGVEIRKATLDQTAFGQSIQANIAKMKTSSITAVTQANSLVNLNWAIGGLSGAMLGYSIAAGAMHEQMYAEAEIMTLLTSIWIGYSTAKAAAFLGPYAAYAGIAAGTGYEALMEAKISEMKRMDRLSRLEERTGIDQSRTYNVVMQNVELNSDGEMFDDLMETATGMN